VNSGKWFAGTRFQTAGYQGAEKDVAAEHENQANCPRHHHRAHPYHHPVCLPRLQMPLRANSLITGFTLDLLYYTATSGERPFGFCPVSRDEYS
jgi:hypothetical protein